jgi:hypothetical protein
METQFSLSNFFAEKVNQNLNLFSFYAKEDKEKVLSLMKKTAVLDFELICQKTKQDIYKMAAKMNWSVDLETQLLIFDKNIFTYVSKMVEKAKK